MTTPLRFACSLQFPRLLRGVYVYINTAYTYGTARCNFRQCHYKPCVSGALLTCPPLEAAGSPFTAIPETSRTRRKFLLLLIHPRQPGNSLSLSLFPQIIHRAFSHHILCVLKFAYLYSRSPKHGHDEKLPVLPLPRGTNSAHYSIAF